MTIFDDFEGPQGGPKISKNRQKAFPKSIEKKDVKKEAMTTVDDEGRRPLAQPKESKISLRKALAKTVTWSKTRQHSRRSAADLAGYAIFRRSPRFLGIGNRE